VSLPSPDDRTRDVLLRMNPTTGVPGKPTEGEVFRVGAETWGLGHDHPLYDSTLYVTRYSMWDPKTGAPLTGDHLKAVALATLIYGGACQPGEEALNKLEELRQKGGDLALYHLIGKGFT